MFGVAETPPGSSVKNSVYIPVALSDQQTVIALGATQGPRGGVYIDSNANLTPFSSWLPFYAQKLIEPLNVDLIPASNWGGSLANLLTASSWEAIRADVLQTTNGVCKICGLTNRGKSVDCHEIWEYHRPLDGRMGIQKLIRILPVCTPCHDMFHLGLAAQKNRLPQTLARLAWANRWSEEEILLYQHYVMAKWEQRNALRWILDLSALDASTKLVLRGGKTGVRVDEHLFLHYETRFAKGFTQFVGVRFVDGEKNEHGPIPAPDYSRFFKDV
jgi:hypothetical protein